jgi:hypothetical protein
MKTAKLTKLIDSKTGKPIEIPQKYIDKIPFMELVVSQKQGRNYRRVLVK